jgi:hypothetical protein
MNEIQKKSQQLKKRQDEQAALNAKIKVSSHHYILFRFDLTNQMRLIYPINQSDEVNLPE